MRSSSSRLLPVALILFAAACVDPQTTPREFTPENVKGYWASVAEDTDGGYRVSEPVLLHFGATLSEFPNETQLSEMTFGGSTYFGPYTLSENGTFVQGGQNDVGNIRAAKLFTGRIVSLTGNEMRLEYAEGVPRPPIVLRRTTGCGVPGTWLPTPGRIQSAAWGPDGALHVLFDFDLESGAYGFVPPGRCSLQRPNVTVSGDGVGVAPNGTVHVIDVRRENPNRPEEGGVFVTEIPAQPWSRPRLDGTTVHLSNSGTSSRPATSVTHLSDSTPILVWGEAGTLHVWRKSGTGYTETRLPSAHNHSLSPQFTQVVPDGQGGIVLSGENAWQRSRLRAGATAWETIELPLHPELGRPSTAAFDSQGRIVGAFTRVSALGTGGLRTVVVSRTNASGTWGPLVEAGIGRPWEIRVRPDGSVDLMGDLRKGLEVMWWAHLPADPSQDSWVQSYHGNLGVNGFTDEYSSQDIIYPFAVWGPSNEVFIGAQVGVSRRPAVESPTTRRPYTLAKITFDNDIPVRLKFPSLGLACEASCTLRLPLREVVPAQIENLGSADDYMPDMSHLAPGGLLYTGGTTIWPLDGADRFAVFTQHSTNQDVPGLGEMELAVRVKKRQMRKSVTVGSTEELPSRALGLTTLPNGNLLALSGTPSSSVITELNPTTLAVVRTRAMTGLNLRADDFRRSGIRVLANGGVVVANYNGPVFLDSSLAPLGPPPTLTPDERVALGARGATSVRIDSATNTHLLQVYTAAGATSPGHLSGTHYRPGANFISLGEVADGWAFIQETESFTRFLVGIGPDGAERWHALAPKLWTTEGDDVIAYYTYTSSLTVQGQQFAPMADPNNPGSGSTGVFIRLDGRTGAIKASRRVPGGVTGAGFDFTAIATAPNRLLLMAPWTNSLDLQAQSWSESDPRALTTYSASVGGGQFCSAPGVTCVPLSGFVLPTATAWALTWSVGNTTAYDGPLLPASTTAVGLFQPR